MTFSAAWSSRCRNRSPPPSTGKGTTALTATCISRPSHPNFVRFSLYSSVFVCLQIDILTIDTFNVLRGI